ncbi:MAG: TerB family tellurite resistance protein, partial [Pirellulaceae bacterium]|nr:TerB family tellurite resistance protein [Pirellulaceae bacterium]
SDRAELQIPPNKQDRIDLLQDLIRTMAADGQLAEIEKRVFAMAAAVMELKEGELNRIIDSVM